MTAYNNLVKRWGMKFSEFCESDIQDDKLNKFENSNKNAEKINKNHENMQKNSPKYQKFDNLEINNDLKVKMDTYQNMTEKELQAELLKEVNKQKQNGTFSLQRIEEVKNKLSPMLTKEQMQKLENLIKMLG